MIKRLIQIPTNNTKIYQQILAIMNFIIDATDQERQVLSELIRLNNEFDALEETKRAKFILSTDMRKEMRENLDIQEKQFNTLISRLKNKELFGKPFLSKEGVLHPELLFKPDDEGYEIVIRIKKQEEQTAVPEKKSEKIENKPKETKEEKTKVSKEERIPPLANGDKGIIENPYEGQITMIK